METLKAQAQKHESSIGALGARWGLLSEASFRNGLKAILEESFGVEVRNVTEYDEKGGRFSDNPIRWSWMSSSMTTC
ncbi:MAG: DUF3782 domain-containing protein [Desulfosoma sp.]|uniref:DUF3782 domain-containing protein n=1 Tax=Desulfosoma sp. TaxID=2603217 RepID=UPI00404959C0